MNPWEFRASISLSGVYFLAEDHGKSSQAIFNSIKKWIKNIIWQEYQRTIESQVPFWKINDYSDEEEFLREIAQG